MFWNRIYDAIEERFRVKGAIKEALDHPVPVHANILKRPSAFLYCFGGIAALIVLLQFVTGVFLTVYYVPSPDHAYDSLEYIKNEVTFGWLVQGIHRWGSSALVVMVVLHMLRVFFQGAYQKPRELNWVAGVCLLLVVLGMSFTGYLLPWDQKAYWATSVGTSMAGIVPFIGDFVLQAIRGGAEVSATTLVRFYAVHIGFIPATMVILLAFHFFMVRRQGISDPL